MQERLRGIATSLSSELAGSTSRVTPPAPTMDSLTQDVDLLEINPLDLFCSSIDTLRGKSIDQIIPPHSGWSTRPTRVSGVSGNDDREEIQVMCRRGIPPSLRCAAWIINVVAAANPD